MNTATEPDGGRSAVDPELAGAIGRMKARALRIRSLNNWMVLGGIILALIPAFQMMVNENPRGLTALYIFGGALCVGSSMGLWLTALLTWRFRPRCPNCGGVWRIVSRADEKRFGKSGKCPYCGIPV